MRPYNRGGRWQPRRGRGTAYRGYETGHDNPAFLLQDLDAQVTLFSTDSERYSSWQPAVRISELNPIASYSWIDAPTLTIAVPGSPWVWASKRAPVKEVPLDSGVQFIHRDASNMGDALSPMLPLFAAIDALHDDFAYKDLDLVTDRNSLRKLLRYIDNVQFRTDFRIDVDLVNKTCLFTRREENAAAEGRGGYGHEYLKAATKAPHECPNMLDHHRAITYKFGRLNILLGCTVDARREPQLDDDEDEFLSSFSSLSIQGAAANKGNIKSFGGLTIQLTSPRSMVPQSDLIEVKTRSMHREVDWKEIYPQLYFAQTEWLYVAKHDRGAFQPVERISLKSEAMRPHAEEVEGSLGKLKMLLEDILRAVRAQGEGVPLSLVCRGGKLSLWKRKAGTGKPLGVEITSKFKGKGSSSLKA